jgi:hypothetical protein
MVPIVTLENRWGIGMLKRAHQLSAGNLWRVFFVSLGLALVVLVFAFVLLALAGLIGALLEATPSQPVDRSNVALLVLQALVVVISVLFQAASSPIFAAAPLLAYLDLRIRREAYDLELLTAAVEERVAAMRAPAPMPGQVGP